MYSRRENHLVCLCFSGHFSQVVWKASAELGIGKAKDSKGRIYVVANYKPAGNFIGQFAQNVFKKK